MATFVALVLAPSGAPTFVNPDQVERVEDIVVPDAPPPTCAVTLASDDPALGRVIVQGTAAAVAALLSVGGGGAVTSVFGRTGAVVAVAGDYNVSQVTGAVALAGQLGGSTAAPDVRGLRTTLGGGTLLAMGAVADGEALVRSGASIIGAPAAPGISAIGGITTAQGRLSDARYYTRGADVFGGLGTLTLGVACIVATSEIDFDPRNICGTRNAVGAAGGGIRWLTPNGFDPFTVGYDIRTNLADISVAVTNRPAIGKWRFFVLTVGDAGASRQIRAYQSGSLFDDRLLAGTTVAAGGDLCLGTTADGVIPVTDGLQSGWVNGLVWCNRELSPDEVAEWTDAFYREGRITGVPGGAATQEGWRVEDVDPGASWAPFLGAAPLARVGTASARTRQAYVFG